MLQGQLILDRGVNWVTRAVIHYLGLIPLFLFAQNSGTISGTVLEVSTGQTIPYCTVKVENSNLKTTSNDKGQFVLLAVPYGNHNLVFSAIGFQTQSQKVNLNQPTLNLKSRLKSNIQKLEAVDIQGKLSGINGFRKMRSVEGVLISEGKKSEVITVDAINSNQAINQGRQIYSKIPGLNIWESDAAGIQLGIGGRGLNPSRTSNFNTRQNGYDISADALGYPESYYTPPTEAVKEIQLIRGAASLQFGTQFGGLLNFVLKDGPNKKTFESTIRHTMGSFNLHSTFASLAIDKKGWKNYTFFQHKIGNESRPNSNYRLYSGGFNLSKQLSEKTKVQFEFTKQYYLAKQPGGLTDKEFLQNPNISKRARNWFEVDWNLAALGVHHDFSAMTTLHSQVFGLLAHRNALGILGNISRPDAPENPRNLIHGKFKNWGNETRFLHRYYVKEKLWTFLIGARFYSGYSRGIQGNADTTGAPKFVFVGPTDSDYRFPSKNVALFTENIFRVTEQFTITPGIRFEHITTQAHGNYRQTTEDLAGNIIFDTTYKESRSNPRSFIIGGIGLNYQPFEVIGIYANFSQNYRSINFTDMQIKNTNFRIDSNLKDETGFNTDVGIRGNLGNKIIFDLSGFALSYDNRIGEIDEVDPKTFIPYRYRTNISQALILGIESFAEIDWWALLVCDSSNFKVSSFGNFSIIKGRYTNSEQSAILNKQVESVPPINFKTGMSIAFKSFSLSYQYSYVHQHFSDATNSGLNSDGTMAFVPNAVVGLIPSYQVMDLGIKYSIKRFQFECGINNLSNKLYFTRRATGYPGPGITPSPARNFYFTLQIKV